MNTDTTTTAPAYSYTAKAEPFEAFSMGEGAKLRTYYRSVVIRSDGVRVWVGDNYTTARSAQPAANLNCGRLRRYLAHHGACWYDRRVAVKAHEKAREAVRKAVSDELREAVVLGTKAAFSGVPEAADEACPYARDTAQGIAWTQAYRLTADRLADFDAENPRPVQP